MIIPPHSHSQQQQQQQPLGEDIVVPVSQANISSFSLLDTLIQPIVDCIKSVSTRLFDTSVPLTTNPTLIFTTTSASATTATITSSITTTNSDAVQAHASPLTRGMTDSGSTTTTSLSSITPTISTPTPSLHHHIEPPICLRRSRRLSSRLFKSIPTPTCQSIVSYPSPYPDDGPNLVRPAKRKRKRRGGGGGGGRRRRNHPHPSQLDTTTTTATATTTTSSNTIPTTIPTQSSNSVSSNLTVVSSSQVIPVNDTPISQPSCRRVTFRDPLVSIRYYEPDHGSDTDDIHSPSPSPSHSPSPSPSIVTKSSLPPSILKISSHSSSTSTNSSNLQDQYIPPKPTNVRLVRQNALPLGYQRTSSSSSKTNFGFLDSISQWFNKPGENKVGLRTNHKRRRDDDDEDDDNDDNNDSNDNNDDIMLDNSRLPKRPRI